MFGDEERLLHDLGMYLCVYSVPNYMDLDRRESASPSGQGSSLALIGAYVLAGELAAASGDHRAAFADYDRAMRLFISVNQELGRQSAGRMTAEPTEAPVDLSGSTIESAIHDTTDRIAEASNAITLKDYSAL